MLSDTQLYPLAPPGLYCLCCTPLLVCVAFQSCARFQLCIHSVWTDVTHFFQVDFVRSWYWLPEKAAIGDLQVFWFGQMCPKQHFDEKNGQRGQSGVQHPECLNDMFITISCCQKLFAFLSRIVFADEQLIWADISVQGCAPTAAAGQVWVSQKVMALGRSSEGGSMGRRVEGEGHPACNGFCPLHRLDTVSEDWHCEGFR